MVGRGASEAQEGSVYRRAVVTAEAVEDISLVLEAVSAVNNTLTWALKSRHW